MQQKSIRHLLCLLIFFNGVNASAALSLPNLFGSLKDLNAINEHAAEDNHESVVEKSNKEGVNRIYSTIRVSRDHSISPRRLCHNGLNIFFKDKKNCKQYGISGFDCEKNDKIAPLRSTEDIYLKNNGLDFVTRFFHIDTQYQYQEVDIASGLFILNEARKIPVCDNREKFKTENVRTRRVIRNMSEKVFVASLIDQSKKSNQGSFLLINSPVGNIGGLENLSGDDIEDQIDSSLARFPVKTPFCSGFNSDLVWQMSGEYTGGGIRSLAPASLQTISQPMFIEKKILVLDKESGQLEQRYVFTCEQVWDI